MTTHRMQLDPAPFAQIKSGQKTIELRLYDEKRRKIQCGDAIVFTSTADTHEELTVTVEELFVFPSFEKLYAALPLTECGYTSEQLPAASPRDMERYYSLSRQQQYGVVGIRIALAAVQTDKNAIL